jgi:hypothetical protein
MGGIGLMELLVIGTLIGLLIILAGGGVYFFYKLVERVTESGKDRSEE